LAGKKEGERIRKVVVVEIRRMVARTKRMVEKTKREKGMSD